MVSALPDEALPELVDDLCDLELQFLKRAQQIEQTPSPTITVNAKVGKPLHRPEFYADGE